MQKWEYQTLEVLSGPDGQAFPTTEKCNELGNEGWELASALCETEDKYAVLIFKRPKG